MTSEASSTKPCEVVIHRERAVAEFVWRGEISLETILAAYDEAAAHPDWRPHFNRLSVYADDLPGDGADFDIVKAVRDGIDDWQARNAPGQHIHAANVVASPFNDALAAVWETLSRDSPGVTVQIFRGRDAALDWLDSVSRSASDRNAPET